MDYNILREELARDEYKSLSDQEAADALNAATVPAVRNVPTREIATWAAANGVMTALYMVNLTPDAPIELKAIVQTLLAVLERLDDWHIVAGVGQPTPAASAMMAALMQAGILDEKQADELIGMATTYTSRGEQLGLGLVLAGHVQMIRAGRA
jgi:hypothetical protein